MKVYINESKEILNVSFVTEKIRSDGTFGLDISLNDTELTVGELKILFTPVTSIKVIRVDMNNEEQAVVFTDYTQIEKIQRRVSDETDITTVSLVKASTRADATETEIAN